MSIRFWLFLSLTIAVVSCSFSGEESGSAGDPSESSSVGSGSSGGNATEATPTVDQSAEALSDEFLAYAFPINSDDLELGRAAYERSSQIAWFLSIADCAEVSGYRTLAADLRVNSVQPAPQEAWLFPDQSLLASRGFAPDPRDTSGPDDLISSLDGQGGAINAIRDLLQRHPDWEIPVEDAEAIDDVLYPCMMAASDQVFGSEEETVVAEMRADWYLTLFEADMSPALASEAEATFACIRGIGEVFSEVESANEFAAAQSAGQIELTESEGADPDAATETLQRWGQEYAGCVEPLMAARRDVRVELRDREVQENLAQLLELQTQVNEGS